MPDTELSGGDLTLVAVVLVISLAALGFAFYLSRAVMAADQGTPKMQEIARAIQEGAGAFLRRQFRTLGVFAVIVFVLLLLLPVSDGGVGTRVGRAVFFLLGAAFSASVGFIGMTLATRGNVRVAAAAAAGGHRPAFRIAFRTGGVCGMITVGLGLFGASLALLLFQETGPVVLEGFGFGGALLAMFMRVGGGIFTKAADVGADLVGKVEAGIPEDDPRNAATIADNVGDNVGDCAGMAADLFESYAVTLVAALILGQVFFGPVGMVFPLVVAAVGIIASIVGILASNPGAGDSSWMAPINRGFFTSAAVSLVLVAVASFTVLPSISDGLDVSVSPQVLGFVSVLIGIVLAATIQQLTGYFTETSRRPVKDVGRSSLTGPATVILSGISLGLESAVYAALLIGAAVYGAFLIGGAAALYAVALAGCGLLTTAGVIVSMDTFGPVSDNAQGIAEMSGEIDEEGAQVLTDLDAVGNTTKAITKGIAIATAVLAATALFGSYNASIGDALDDAGATLGDAFTLVSPNNVVGAVIGAAVVFFFSGLAISAVSRAAGRVVFEVREQFRTRPGIMDYSERPDYGAVVDICTKDSLRELATPGLLAVLAPVAVGFGLGFGPLAAYLVGAIATGTLMAVFLSNSGGAWDNAKKMVEDGAYGGKGSQAHAATVIGDTVGDPFKDTAGPAINPLIKVMNLVALLIAPAIVGMSVGDDENTTLRVLIALGATLVIVVAVVISKRRSIVVGGESDTTTSALTTSAP
ncbi:sodium-translocating pyrophosphatase [Modestobacter versicolor]|uniref:K(+)-insensitive pyrophosphate-energized proton pump n=1 Tax=Modestobacter versicolor TaxID=429133 RepID=A0A323V7W2_9ACTN|nr:sodium-translocating pyrophosphatase [Modestobacter versicolor]MBB3676790.1 K(+)-stimulated pyrophosphate-energized sodium pump [Modestobacter versicolor]PZA19406.1 sodium-translocating pyrophosphatase [Modestobacter versicolor]